MDAAPHYLVNCTGCDWQAVDDGVVLDCPYCREGSLLTTRYSSSSFAVSPQEAGIFRYRSWLPVFRDVPGSSGPVVYRSAGLGRELGLDELWIAFSGFWPERGCHMESGTFKELEAYAVLGRTPRDAGVMVIASAGNTGAAFASVAAGHGVACLVVVPQYALPMVERVTRWSDEVRVLALEDADYNDTIDFSRKIVATGGGFFPEGGVRNVARRDGLAVVALSAFEAMGVLPEAYVQAVGSGTGAIATYEASSRIAASGLTPGQSVPRMLLCQNAQFAPLARAWNGGARPVDQPRMPQGLYAPELANAAPPFSVRGGVRDVLASCSGEIATVTREAAVSSRALFERLEGIDIEPAAAVAVAGMREAVSKGQLSRDTRILLNVTGGGRIRAAQSAAPETPGRNPLLVNLNTSPIDVAARLLKSFHR
ncbi:cysteate synthase [Streptomyces sp. NPDC094038]|uniref:cysteate synthase n=1 Tax=Streptomyces sp. NPDC094038 TaxID=3366055 RepID=UPI0038058780